MPQYGFRNLPAPVQGTGAQVGSLGLGKYQAEVQRYQAERAAERADRELQLREQEAKDRREAARRKWKQYLARLKALGKITGPDGEGGGLGPEALGPEPEPPMDLVAPRATMPHGAAGPLLGPEGSYGTVTPPTSPESFGGVTARGPGQLPALPPATGIPGPVGQPGGFGREGLPAYPGPLGETRKAEDFDRMDRLFGMSPEGQAELARLQAGAPQKAQEVVGGEMELADAEAAERARQLLAEAGAGPGQVAPPPPGVRDMPRMPRELDEIIGDTDVAVTGPVPGAGVPSRPRGFAPSTRPAGYPPLSAEEAAATRRAGGLVFEGAPRATDYAMPRRRPAPAPQAPGARGAAAKKKYLARLDKAAVLATAMGDGEMASGLRLRASQIRAERKAAAEAEKASKEAEHEANVAQGVTDMQNATTRKEVGAGTSRMTHAARAEAGFRAARQAALSRIAADEKATVAAAKVKAEEDVAEWATTFTKEYDGHVRVYTKAQGAYRAEPAKHAELHGGKEMDMLDVFLAQRKSIEAAPVNLQKAMREQAERDYAAAIKKLGPGPKVTAEQMSPAGWDALQGAVQEPGNDAGAVLAAMMARAMNERTTDAVNDYRVAKWMLSGLMTGQGTPMPAWLKGIVPGVEAVRQQAAP